MAGALRIVVPGNFPIGCFPFILNVLRTNDTSAYDRFGCLISVNNLAILQNNDLQGALDSLGREFPNVVILYADYYNAFQSLLQDATVLGIDSRNLLKVCCGVEGGQYNPLGPDFCGNPSVPVCSNPNRYIHWDGIHLTQKAYGRIATIIIEDIILRIKCFQ
ncbi:hypothetical protein RD792_012847 [Penstemon davidsonii]|uniref:Uncharacterized protein n=1 Tax=Penstemon davidsonii TaxID=160366 RepID=A0ABR0CYV0_9LAMI|nr:hypothetical protein RD792_012847 [Penstemon davidsonii]